MCVCICSPIHSIHHHPRQRIHRHQLDRTSPSKKNVEKGEEREILKRKEKKKTETATHKGQQGGYSRNRDRERDRKEEEGKEEGQEKRGGKNGREGKEVYQ